MARRLLSPEATERLLDLVRSDTPIGFEIYYTLLYNLPLPRHSRRWINRLYEVIGRKQGVVVYAFRESTKTTTITNGLASYRIGCHPELSGLIVQVSEDAAGRNGKQLAGIIEHNPAWKLCFPYVTPDPGRAWGIAGYEVKDERIPYGEFRRRRGPDPSFVALSYTSGPLLGMHPSNFLFVDDINNDRNSFSAKERLELNRIVQGTLFPGPTAGALVAFVGTPWTDGDVLSYVSGTGEFEIIETPIFEDLEEDEDEEQVALVDPAVQWYPEMGKWVRLTWPERFSVEETEKRRKRSGTVEFSRMYLLNTKVAGGARLKREWLFEYPGAQIDQRWPGYIGVDYASALPGYVEDRDYCAISWGRVMPSGGIVLQDGLMEKLSQGEAEEKVKAIFSTIPNVKAVGIEDEGKGEEFGNRLQMTSRLPIVKVSTKKRSKAHRFEIQMAPHFEFGRVWISDAQTNFLAAFKDQWLLWPNTKYDDALDSVYVMLRVAHPHLWAEQTSERDELPVYGRKRKENPYVELARMGRHG